MILLKSINLQEFFELSIKNGNTWISKNEQLELTWDTSLLNLFKLEVRKVRSKMDSKRAALVINKESMFEKRVQEELGLGDGPETKSIKDRMKDEELVLLTYHLFIK